MTITRVDRDHSQIWSGVVDDTPAVIRRYVGQDVVVYCLDVPLPYAPSHTTRVAHMRVDREHRYVLLVHTDERYRRRGYARALWEQAQQDGGVLHDAPHHRTEEGDAWAVAVGGETVDHRKRRACDARRHP